MSDDAAAGEAVELSSEEKAAIDGMYVRLANTTLYDLLEVKPDADRKALRDAYFGLSQRFHPDAFFGRKMGPWKARLEAIFRECTQAYEVLGNKKRRAEYDASLGRPARVSIPPPRRATPAPAPDAPRSLTPAPSPAVGPKRSATPAPFDLEGFLPLPEVPPAPAEPKRAVIAPPAPAPVPPAPVPQRAPLSADSVRSQREALARRLAGLRGGATGSAPPVQSSPVASLKHQQMQSRGHEFEQRIENLRNTAVESEKRGDWTAASNALHVAVGLVPERSELRAEYEALTKRQAEALSARAEKEAREAESMLDWKTAAEAWQKVTQWRPDDGPAYERGAYSLWKVGTDLRRAAELARRAVQLRPDSLQAQVTLGYVFLSGGLRASAEAALVAAAKLDPNAQAVKDLEKKLKG